jgi:hypothetical protein
VEVVAGKLIKGILGALDERLGTHVLSETAGKSLAGMAKITPSRVPGILSRELRKEEVHPDIWNAAFGEPLPEGYAPLYRGFHGSNSRTPFDRPVGGLRDIGVSMSSSPDAADFHSLGRYDVLTKGSDYLKEYPIGTPGIRVYPLLADPGRSFKFPRDTQDWSDPENVYQKTIKDPNYNPDQPDMKGVMKDLRRGHSVDESLRDWGYDSIEYPHINPWHVSLRKDFGDTLPFTSKALTVFDPKRVVPEFSEVGQKAVKVRGVLASEPSTKPEATLQDYNDLYGGDRSTPDEFLEHMFDVNNSRLGKLETLGEIMGNSKNKLEESRVLLDVKDLAGTMSPLAIQDGINGLHSLMDTFLEMGKSTKSGVDTSGAIKHAMQARDMIKVLKKALKSK